MKILIIILGLFAAIAPISGALAQDPDTDIDMIKSGTWIKENRLVAPTSAADETHLPVRAGSSKILFDTYTEQAKKAMQAQSYAEAAKFYQLALDQTGGWPADDSKTIGTINRLIEINTNLNRADKAEIMREQLRVIGKCLCSDADRFLPQQRSQCDAAVAKRLMRADALCESGSIAEAEKVYVDLYNNPSGTACNSPTLKSTVANRLARIYCGQGDPAKAETLLAPLLKDAESALSVSPESADCQLAMASVLSGLSLVHCQKGELVEAEAVCLQAFKYAEWAKGKNSQPRYFLLNDLGQIHLKMQKPQDAVKDFRQAVEIAKRDRSGVTNPELRRGLENLAKALKAEGHDQEAQVTRSKAERLTPNQETAEADKVKISD